MMTLANMGLPLIGLHWGFAIVGFLPVVAIETWVLRRRLGTPVGRGAVATVVANLVTTILGVPIAFVLYGFALTGFEFVLPDVLVRATWFRFFEDALWLGGPDFTKYPAAAAVFLVPCLFLSILVERPIVRAVLRAERGPARRAVRDANLASYALLFAVCIGWFAWSRTVDVGLTFRQARDLVEESYQAGWGGCFPDRETRPGYSEVVARGGWLGPPEPELSLSVADRAAQECIAKDVQRRLEQLSAGPFTLRFPAPVEFAKERDTGWTTVEGEPMREIRLDGRTGGRATAAFLSPGDESEH
jgi:hypothetical protein